MTLLYRAEKSYSVFKNCIEKIENFERSSAEDVTIFKKIQDLKRELIKGKENAEQTVQEIKKSKEPLRSLEEEITKQDARINDLETKLSAT